MKNTCIFLLLFLTVAFAACDNRKKIADNSDYEQFLDPRILQKELRQTKQALSFWDQRLQTDTGSYVNMLELGRYNLELFQQTGDIHALNQGDSLLKAASAKLKNTDPEILFALSQNSISLHRFRNAAFYNESAEKAGPDLYTLRLLQFDVAMELGQYSAAEKCLGALKDKTSFDHLIRRSKWEDHKGDLEKAIELMEKAREKVINRKGLYSWALSNLGDMYGHAGRVEDSYQAYLEVLSMDPSNLHCLQGIAWIAYAQDGNISAAKKILQFITTVKDQPEIKLILAEFAEAEGKLGQKQVYEKSFIRMMDNPAYGAMYNKYLIELFAEDQRDPGRAIALAKKELENRFTPETCDWLAWAYFQKGDIDSAYSYAKNYVYQHTYEPEAMLHTGIIFSAKGRREEAKKMLEGCLESAFELGPVKTATVKRELAKLR